VRDDAQLNRLHHATTRRPVATPLRILAFDHRAQLEALAAARSAPLERIAQFKALVAEAFVRVAAKHAGAGVILDDRYGEALLPRLTAHGWWIARPVEVPGSIPVAFEEGANLGLAMRTWPTEHVAKCLVLFHPDDPEELRAAQVAQMRALERACTRTGREMLLEVIPTARPGDDAFIVARALEAIYAAGVRADWWKLPPGTDAGSWLAIDQVIERHDPLCRGVLVLGMEAGAHALRQGFAAASRSRWVRGFAVGRSIFARAAHAWFRNEWPDTRVVEDVSQRYEEVIALWEKRGEVALSPDLSRENA
jgi:5-dehydro-2-deoxygluconokinase